MDFFFKSVMVCRKKQSIMPHNARTINTVTFLFVLEVPAHDGRGNQVVLWTNTALNSTKFIAHLFTNRSLRCLHRDVSKNRASRFLFFFLNTIWMVCSDSKTEPSRCFSEHQRAPQLEPVAQTNFLHVPNKIKLYKVLQSNHLDQNWLRNLTTPGVFTVSNPRLGWRRSCQTRRKTQCVASVGVLNMDGTTFAVLLIQILLQKVCTQNSSPKRRLIKLTMKLLTNKSS